MPTTPFERSIAPLASIREVVPGSFIFERPLALPPVFCDGVIERFEAHPEQQYEGRIGQVRAEDRGIKQTTDLVVSNKPDWKDVGRDVLPLPGRGAARVPRDLPLLQGALQGHGLPDPALPAGRVLPLAHRRRQPRVQPAPVGRPVVPQRRAGSRAARPSSSIRG